MQLKVMTYNTLHGMDWHATGGDDQIKLELIAETIRKSGADLVGLNEVRDKSDTPDYDAQAKIIAQLLGWNYFFARAITFPNGGKYGNALLTRFPIEKAEALLIPDPPVRDEDAYYETRGILKARIDVGGGLDIFVSHFGLAQAEMKNAVAAMCQQVRGSHGPHIVMGDFNMAPDDPKLQPLLALMDDSAAKFTQPKLSWPAEAPRIKIDYLLTGGGIRVLEADIPQIGHSDHLPHTAVIEW